MTRTPAVLLALALLGASCSSGDDGGAAPTGDGGPTTTTTAPAREPLDDQTPPPSVNGVVVDGDVLWVASIAGDEVLAVDRASGAILERHATGGAGPDDVAVAPDGSVWVTGFSNGDLGRIADGTYEVVVAMEPGINPIDTSGPTVLVGTFGPEGRLYAIDTEGGEPIDGAEPQLIAEGLPDINGFAVAEDGTVIAPAGGIGGPGSVVAIDARGGIATLADGLPGVAALAAGPDGRFAVLANVEGGVYDVDPATGATSLAHELEGVPFDNLAFADDGTLYVSSFTSPELIEIAPDGTQRTIAIGR